jgi:hypothetical protein
MCFYTMRRRPLLSHFGEACDNFASCLDIKYGAHNGDPRADDFVPFNCATYSFCPGMWNKIKKKKKKLSILTYIIYVTVNNTKINNTYKYVITENNLILIKTKLRNNHLHPT